MVRVRCFVIGVGDGIRPGVEWARRWAIFSLGGDLVYSSIVLAPLCGDVHKRRVYIGVFLEEDGILDPDPCKVCSPPPFSWKWKRVVASSWKWNSDPGVYVDRKSVV